MPTIRYTAQYLVDNGTVVDGRYFVDEMEVAVLYFRTMYDPAHFKTPDFWRARRDMEFSAAVTVSSLVSRLFSRSNLKLSFQYLGRITLM